MLSWFRLVLYWILYFIKKREIDEDIMILAERFRVLKQNHLFKISWFTTNQFFIKTSPTCCTTIGLQIVKIALLTFRLDFEKNCNVLKKWHTSFVAIVTCVARKPLPNKTIILTLSVKYTDNDKLAGNETLLGSKPWHVASDCFF